MSCYDEMEAVLHDVTRIEAAAVHGRWQVRYAAAMAIAQHPEPRWLPVLHNM